MSFLDYKRMHWVVCKTCRMLRRHREDVERTSRGELERFSEHA
jgi:hypothetical protein